MASIFRAGARFVIGVFFKVFTRCYLIGGNRIIKKGPLIVVANHPSLFDPPLIGTILRREACFMAKEGLFSSGATTFLLKALGAFPLGRNQLSRQALKQTLDTIKKGKVLVIFPEGGRSDHGRMRKAMPGAVVLAIKLKAPILPIAISDTQRITSYKDLLRRPRIKVIVGEAFYPEVGDGSIKGQAAETTDMIMQHIAALLPQEYHGYYATRGESVGA